MRAKSTVSFVFSAMLGSAILASPLFGSVANAALIGPILPYFGISDSPFNGLPFVTLGYDTAST